MLYSYSPAVKWDPQVAAYLEHAFGPAKLQQMSTALTRPSLTCLRVNTRTTSPQEVVQQLQQLVPGSQPYVHPVVDSAVILPGGGPLEVDTAAAAGREVVINRLAGEAVLQGAHVFAPGLLAASPGVAEGEVVAVTVAVEQAPGAWCGINRGARLTPELQQQLPGRQQLCVGLGRLAAGRRQLFRQQDGLAVEMVQRVFDVTSCNGLLPGQVLLQSLPCVVAAAAVDAQPGSRVLDMCAAPGGKTSMLAQQMAGNSASQLVALDRTAAKVARVQQLVDQWGVGDVVQAMAADATLLYQQGSSNEQRHRQGVDLQGRSQQHSLQQQAEAAEMHAAPESDASSQPSISNSSSSSSSSRLHSSSKRRRQGSTRRQQPDPQQQQLQLAEVLAAAQPESFDAVLLDAPCSALGLRPRLLMGGNMPQLEALAAYQRALVTSAVAMVKPGGTLVYCTCTINPGENEANVRYLLDKWPDMKLVQQPLVLGGPGLVGPSWLTAAEAQLVQRFDVAAGLQGGGADDTIGFFIAKFVKTGSTQ